MNLSKLIPTVSATALAFALAAPAHAAFQVLDGWELVTPVTNTTNIGRLNVVSGSAIVEQELNGLGQVFVGSRFVESGLVFSLTYTPENVVGAGDIGAPQLLGDFLTISFTNVAGHVTQLVGTGFRYVFDSGTYSISGTGGAYATGSIVGIGGTASSTAVIGGFNGDSTALGTLLASIPGFDMKDNLGNSILPALGGPGGVLFEVVTNNLLANVVGQGPCSFAPSNPANGCVRLNVASAGDAYLVRQIPEPTSLALAGLALFGIGASARRRSKKA